MQNKLQTNIKMICLNIGSVYLFVLKGQLNSAQWQRLGIKIFSSDFRTESAA